MRRGVRRGCGRAGGAQQSVTHHRHPAPAGSGMDERGDDMSRHAPTRIARARTSCRTTSTTLRDEVIYLKVKLRKEGTVTRSEYNDVRDGCRTCGPRPRRRDRTGRTGSQRQRSSGHQPVRRPADGRRRAAEHGGSAARRRPTQPVAATAIPAGQELDVRLQNRADVGYGAGRGSVRSHHRRRSVSRATAC